MTFVIGRTDGASGPTGRLGSYRALDGSEGAALAMDLDSPHAALVVGKRGYGKSYTLGVIAENLAGTGGLAPVVVDPMGEFATLAESTADCPATVVANPTVSADSLDPRSWCDVLDCSPASGVGGLLWQAATHETTVDAMREHIDGTECPAVDRRAARNHLRLAASWSVFDPDGLTASDLSGPEVTVLDLSGVDAAPANAVVRGVAESLYRARVDDQVDRLPWLLVDEAHAFFDGIASPALRRLPTRGRTPGVSLVLATQRPSAVPAVAVSQSDLLLAHRLTSGADIEALGRAQPTYMDGTLAGQLPAEPGDALVVDDATESVHRVTVRQRRTPHSGGSPRASEVSVGSD